MASQNEYDNGMEGGFYLPSVLSYAVGAIPTERKTVIVVPSTTSLTAGTSSRCQFLFPQSGLLDFSNAELTMDANYVIGNASNYVALHTNPLSVFSVAEQDLGGQTLVVSDINIATNAYYKAVLDASALSNKATYDIAGDSTAQWAPSTQDGYVGDLVCQTANTRNNISRVIPLEMFQGVFAMNKYFPAFLAPQLRLTLQVANLASIGYESSAVGGTRSDSLSSSVLNNFRLRVPQIQLPPAVSQAIQMASQQGLMARSNFTRVYSKSISSNGESIIINQSARAGIDGVVFGLVKSTDDNPYSARLGTTTSGQYRVRIDGQDVVSQALDNRELLNALCNFLQKPYTADSALAFRGKEGYTQGNGWGGLAFEMSNTRIPQEMLTGYTSGQTVQVELIAENTGNDGNPITGTGFLIVDTAVLYNFSQAGVSMVY